MLCEKASSLLHQLRNTENSLTPYDEETIREVTSEINAHVEMSKQTLMEKREQIGNPSIAINLLVNKAITQRNKECVLAYL